jgi:hypothetical protein
MKKPEPQGYEVAPYSDVEFGTYEAHKVIMQIFHDLVRDSPAHAVWGDMVGDQLRIRHQTVVVNLPMKVAQTEDECEQVFKSTVSWLKKEFKDRTGKALKLAEDKELRGHTTQKVSLNLRYYYTAWRSYAVSF